MHDIDVQIVQVDEWHLCLFHMNLRKTNFTWLVYPNHGPWSLWCWNTWITPSLGYTSNLIPFTRDHFLKPRLFYEPHVHTSLFVPVPTKNTQCLVGSFVHKIFGSKIVTWFGVSRCKYIDKNQHDYFTKGLWIFFSLFSHERIFEWNLLQFVIKNTYNFPNRPHVFC